MMIRIFLFLFCVFITQLAFSQSSNQKEFVLVSELLPENHVKDGSVDYTDIIQDILNQYSNVLFPDYPLLINSKGLDLRSNSCISFLEGGSIILKENDKTHYEIFDIRDKENIQIEGGELVGDRTKHLNDHGEWGMGINIIGGRNIKIHNMRIRDCWGDGIYIANSSARNSSNIEILSCLILRARRNGISLISGENIFISDCKTQNILGTLPMAGLDIEPNNHNSVIENVVINDFSSRNCNIGIQIGLSRYPSKERKRVSINIHDFVSDNDSIGVLLGDYYRKKQYGEEVKKLEGHILFSNLRICHSQKEPIKYFSEYGYEYSPLVKMEGVQIYKIKKILRISKLENDLKKRSIQIRKLDYID